MARNVCFPSCPLSTVFSPSHEKTEISDLPKDGYSEVLPLMQWKDVAERSRAHLTLENPLADAGDISIQGLPPKCLSHRPQCSPSGSQWWSSIPGNKLNVESLLTAWATLCFLWATWIEKNNFTGQKNVLSRNSFVIWVRFLTILYFTWVLCQLRKGPEWGREPNGMEINISLCLFCKDVFVYVISIHFSSTCLPMVVLKLEDKPKVNC